MKKLIILLFLALPAFVVAQNRIVISDTTTVVADTVIYHKISNSYYYSWQLTVNSLTGNDATAELVVCNKATVPTASDWSLLADNMKYTIDTTGVFSPFADEMTPYDWIGIRLTKNSVSAWDLSFRLVMIKD